MAGIIIPHLNKSINVRNVRRYALTCERFDAYEAKRIGLVHEVCEENEIEEKKNMIVEQLLLSEPKKRTPDLNNDSLRSVFCPLRARFCEVLEI